MAVRAYILVQVASGQTGAAQQSVAQAKSEHGRVLTADAVTGPYDIIAVVEADDLNALGRLVTDGIQKAPGVERTLTCVAVQV